MNPSLTGEADLPRPSGFRNVGRWLRRYAVLCVFFLSPVYYLVGGNRELLDHNTYLTYVVVIAAVLIGIRLQGLDPVTTLGLDFGQLDRRTWMGVLAMIIIENMLLLGWDVWLGSRFTLRPFQWSVWLVYIFGLWVRPFGEELIFRGFLLSRRISGSPKRFWIGTLIQAVIFTGIHALIVMPMGQRVAFVTWVFISSIIFALLNRRCHSLLPSTLIHATSGLLTSILLVAS